MWNLHPSELMVLISGRQIQFCTVSDGLKRHSCIYCNQPEFLPGLHYLVFYFLLPFISHFSPWFYMELSKFCRMFRNIHCTITITPTFPYLTVFASLTPTSSFLLLTSAPVWCLQCDQ